MSEASIIDSHGSTESRPTGLEKAISVLTAAAILASLLGSYVILPYRVAAVEKRVEAQATDHDILLRIEEDVKQIQKSLDKKGNP